MLEVSNRRRYGEEDSLKKIIASSFHSWLIVGGAARRAKRGVLLEGPSGLQTSISSYSRFSEISRYSLKAPCSRITRNCLIDIVERWIDLWKEFEELDRLDVER